MPSYYRDVLGNIKQGKIAKSSDIHHIQRHIKDALKAQLSDLHDGESYVLGSGNDYKNSFVLKPAQKIEGRYLDTYWTFEDTANYLNINLHEVWQPIVKTKTSLYSIIAKFKNTSNKDIPIVCKLVDEEGKPQRTTHITLLKNTPIQTHEIVFDLDYYPTPPNFDLKKLQERDGKDLPPKVNEKEESFDKGYEEDFYKDEHEEERLSLSAGVGKLYFVIEAVNTDATQLAENAKDKVIFDANTSLGVYCKAGDFFPGEKEIFAEIHKGDSVEIQNSNIYYKDVYANQTTYLCSGGQAIIDGEKIRCLDTHISVENGNESGNVLTQIYLGNDGHLHYQNKKASFTTDISKFVDDEDDRPPFASLPIALILTYSNALYGLSKEPLIIQDDYDQLPRSHHERLRRLEKQMNWSNDIALPARIKCTYSDKDWIDENGENLVDIPYSKGEDSDKLPDGNIFTTTDENGNIVVQLTDAISYEIPVTLKEKLKDSDGNEIELKETDDLNISAFSKIKNMVHDSENGTLQLDNERAADNKTVATTAKEAELTEYNPWDDSKQNRPVDVNFTKNEREYKVVSGKNGANDNESSYPGMTFYTDTNYKFKKLTIPIYKFQNCSSVKFYIWKRQETNNKKNQVPYFNKQQLIYTSKSFSLKKAKEKGDYQYMDDGFTIDFGEGGLPLKKGQYVIVALPTPKSGTGSLFVETYKPGNSKDFCIRYVGAANASHFDYSEAYQEIWYNSTAAIVSKEKYYTSGQVVSKTKTWTEKGLERIKTVKPIIDENLTLGNTTKDSYELYVSTGGDWIKMTPNKDNKITSGGATTFKWKLIFNGDGKSTPKLSFNKKTGYAIKFIITREKPASELNLANEENINKNMCITSKAFDGDDILRQYIGDLNFGLTHSRFEGYEFARVWANENQNKKLLIDIQASDRTTNYEIKKDDNTMSGDVSLWSLHYCDLTLDDFDKISVDYSDYDSTLEYDENNMRLKLDSEHSYNDDDIEVMKKEEFLKVKNDIDSSEDSNVILSNNSTTENQVLLKKIFENELDLTKYTGLKFKFSVSSKETASMILRGLGIYISSTETIDVPSNLTNLPENLAETDGVLTDEKVLVPVIDPDVSSESYYEGKIIQIHHVFDKEKDGNKIYKIGSYQYVQQYDENKKKYVWKLQQIFDLKPYSLYEIGDISYFDDDKTFEVRIEIDQQSTNMKHVKEIGIITLNDENKFKIEPTYIKTSLSAKGTKNPNKITITLKDETGKVLSGEKIYYGTEYSLSKTTNGNGEISVDGLSDKDTISFKYKGQIVEKDGLKTSYAESILTVDYDFTKEENFIEEEINEILNVSSAILKLESVRAISQEVLTIYNPNDVNVKFVPKKNDNVVVIKNGSTLLDTETYSSNTGGSTDLSKIKETTPLTTQVCIKYKDNSLQDKNVLCYVNNPFTGRLSDYKHLGIQIATDAYLPKNCLKINLCSDYNGEEPFASVNLPTMNSIYYPNKSEKAINLSQVFKKFEGEDIEIKSISISTTSSFSDLVNSVINESKPAINLFIGKIVLYRARTIPIYHNKMRFKFYCSSNGEIDRYGQKIIEDDETINIRKVGAVLDYD